MDCLNLNDCARKVGGASWQIGRLVRLPAALAPERFVYLNPTHVILLQNYSRLWRLLAMVLKERLHKHFVFGRWCVW